MNSLDLKYNTFYNDKDNHFSKLVDCIENCRLCPNMECRSKVFSENNGNIYSNVLFIAEAPGRLGADRTMIPLFGDQTGVNFQKLIDSIGWSRESFFITNAILCNPRDEKGNNTTPSKEHLINCSTFLQILIDIMKPEYIITLGQKALESLQIIQKFNVSLKNDVRKIISWNGYNIIPLYHTGPRAMVHRSYFNQLSDFYWIHKNIKVKAKPWERLDRSNLPKKIREVSKSQSSVQKLIIEILSKLNKISEFKLTKLIYLIDYEYLKLHGRLLTNSYYIRSFNGPIPAGLDKQLEELLNVGVIEKNRGKYTLKVTDIKAFSDMEKAIIQEVALKYSKKTDAEIKTAAYLTLPMKRILRQEKATTSMLHKPVFTEEDFNINK